MINIEQFWDDCKNELSIRIQTISYEVWIDKLMPVCFIDDTMVLSTISASSKRTVDNKYLETIKEIVTNLNSSIANVLIITKDEEEQYLKNQTEAIPGSGFVYNEPVVKTNVKSQFLDKYTFDTFIQGKSNQYALAACKTVAEDPGNKFNPLFIYSGVGLGKTHLLHAIGNYICKNTKRPNVLYISAESLTNELVSVIRDKSQSNEANNRFREKYRSCDVLLVDDIQSLIGREGTQEAFFNIFNDLYQENKQIILTSDRAPKDLTTLEERLRTRFSWGLTVDIQIPDMETRVAILKSKAAQSTFLLEDEVAEFIAEISTTNIREMEGLLNKVIFYSSLTNNVIKTKELAMEALADFIEPQKETIDAADIIDTVCKYYRISQNDLISKKKTKNLVEPRMIAIYLIIELIPMPLDQIGQMIGGRDHTTIMHARDKITEALKSDKRIKIIVADIKNMLLNK